MPDGDLPLGSEIINLYPRARERIDQHGETVSYASVIGAIIDSNLRRMHSQVSKRSALPVCAEAAQVVEHEVFPDFRGDFSSHGDPHLYALEQLEWE